MSGLDFSHNNEALVLSSKERNSRIMVVKIAFIKKKKKKRVFEKKKFLQNFETKG